MILMITGIADKPTSKALEELSALLRYLRIWGIEQSISIDVLMPPTETCYQNLFFQVVVIFCSFTVARGKL